MTLNARNLAVCEKVLGPLDPSKDFRLPAEYLNTIMEFVRAEYAKDYDRGRRAGNDEVNHERYGPGSGYNDQGSSFVVGMILDGM